MLSLFLACQTPTAEPDPVRYQRLMTLADPDPAVHLDQCLALAQPALQGECQLVIAQRAAPSPGALCDAIAAPIWQWECYFLAAESVSDDDPAAAAALCLSSGGFADHCSQHLWQQSLRRLTWHRGADAFADTLPRAEHIFTSWAPYLAAQTDFTVRFWRRYYEGGFERSGRIDLSFCAGLPGEHPLRCRAAGSTLYSRRIGQIRHIEPAMRTLCALPEPTSAAAAASGVPEFRAAPDEALDAVIARVQGEACDGAEPILSARPVMVPDPR